MKQNEIDTLEPKAPKPFRGVQPKTHAPKTRAASALRRKMIIDAIIEGKDHVQAGIDSGLSPRTARVQVSQILNGPKVLESLNAATERLGLDDQSLALQLKKLILGVKLIPATIIDPDSGSKEKGYVEVPDYAAKARGLHLAFKLLGHYGNKTNINIKPPVKIVIENSAVETRRKAQSLHYSFCNVVSN